MLKRIFFVYVMITLTAFISIASANAGVTGRLKGKVIDKETREPLPGATIKIEGTYFEASTDANGEFYFIAVEAGTYELRATLEGYSDFIFIKTTLFPDQVTEILIELLHGSDTVDHSEMPFQINDPYHGTRVTSDTYSKRPYRKLVDIVTNSTTSIYQRNGTQYVRAGAPGEMGYYMNGTLMNDGFTGSTFLQLPYGAIDHIVIHAGGFDAKFGNFGSGITQIIPKRGGDTFKGSAEYVSDIAASAMGSESYGRNIYSLTFSGPIIKKSLRFFAAGELSQTDDANPGVFGYPLLKYHNNGIKNPDPTLNDTVLFETDQNGNIKYKKGARPGHVNSEKLTNVYGNLSYTPNASLEVDAMALYSFSERNMFRTSYLLMPGREPHSERSTIFGGLNGTYYVSNNIYAKANIGFYSTNYDEIQRDLFSKGSDAALLLNIYTRGNTMASSYYGDNLIYDIDRGSIAFKKSESDAWSGGLELGWRYDNINFFQTGFQTQVNTIRFYDLLDPGYPYGGSNNFFGYRVVSSPEHFKLKHQNSDDFTEGTDGAKKPVNSYFYIQDEVSLEALRINFGLRGDFFDPGTKILRDISSPTGPNQQLGPEDFKSSETEFHWAPRFAVFAKMSEETSVRAHYGLYWHSRPFNNYYVGMDFLERQSIAPPFTTLIGNSTLKLQKTELIEISVDYRIHDIFFASGSIYQKNITNAVGTGLINSYPNGLFVNGNYDMGRVTGFEGNLTCKISKNITAGFSLSILETDISGTGENSGFRAAWLGYSDEKFSGPMGHEQSETFRLYTALDLNKKEGPVVSGCYLFENMSAFIFGNWQSGFPYTPTETTKYGLVMYQAPRPVARRNSENLPSTFSIDVKIIKHFEVAKNYRASLYVEILNILNRKNVVGVFEATGKPNDDGFLAFSGSSLSSRELQQYQYILNDNFHYSNPRLVNMGLQLEF